MSAADSSGKWSYKVQFWKTEVYKGKQDDLYFVSPKVGFYGNGAGKISNLPTKNADPMRVKNHKPEGAITSRRLGGGGNSSPRLASSQSRNSSNSMGGHGGRH